MGETNYYEILGIDANATEDDIRKAYRRQALLWHPDKNTQRKEEAEAKFKLIAEAYEVLSDSEKRRVYDLYGEDGLKNSGTGYDFGSDSDSAHYGFQFHDPWEIFNSFFGGRDHSEFFGNRGFGQSPFGQSPFGQSPFVQSPFGQSLFGQSPFGQSPFGMSGFGSRSLFDDHTFGNLSGMPSSSSYSFSSISSGGDRGGYVKKSTTTQIVNGVRKTVTETVDAQGNVTVVTETSDGRRQVLVNNKPQEQNLIDQGQQRVNIPVQDGNLLYGQQQQQQQQQQPQPQSPRLQQPQQFQQQYQQYQPSSSSSSQQQFQSPPYQQQQYQQQYQDSQQQTHNSKEDNKKHKRDWFHFRKT